MGAEQFDLGRSGSDDPGLIAFKGHLGAVTSESEVLSLAQFLRAKQGAIPTENLGAASLGLHSRSAVSWCRPIVVPAPG